MRIGKEIIAIIFGLCSSMAVGQVNQVQNPSFELFKSCPTGFYQADSLYSWNWINAACDTVTHNECKGSLLSSCSSASSCAVPKNWFGYQNARTGSSYVSLLTIGAVPPAIYKNDRTYLRGNLISTLVAGKTYCLRFYYNAPNLIEYATNRFGAYIDDGSIGNNDCCKDIGTTPQAENSPSQFMNDTANWVPIANTFVANGSEISITLGNFVDSATIQFQLFNSSGWRGPYYFIDDVSVIPTDLPSFAGNDTSIILGDSVYIGRPSEVGLDDDCFWYALGNSTPFDTIAGLWVKPPALGNYNYVLEQNICGTVTYDTVTVTVTPNGIVTNRKPEIKMFPNPANDFFIIETAEQNLSLKISDVLGKEVWNEKFSGDKKIDLGTINNGIYVVKVKTEKGIVTKKIVIQK